MVASILQIGISRNPICDNLVGFPKSGHIYQNLESGQLKFMPVLVLVDCITIVLTIFLSYKCSLIMLCISVFK